MSSFDSIIAQDISEDAKAFFFLGLGGYAHAAYMNQSEAGQPEPHDGYVVLPKGLQADMTNETAIRLVNALHDGGTDKITNALIASQRLRDLCFGLVDNDVLGGIQSIDRTVIINSDHNPAENNPYFGLTMPRWGLSMAKDRDWVFEQKKMVYDRLRATSVAINGHKRQLQHSPVVAVDIVNVIFAYFDTPGMQQASNIVSKVKNDRHNPAILGEGLVRGVNIFAGSCPVLATLCASFPMSLSRIWSEGWRSEIDGVLSARRHYEAIRDVLHALADPAPNPEDDIRAVLKTYNVNTKARTENLYHTLAQVFGVIAGHAFHGHDSILKHIRLACYYGYLGNMCDGMLLLQPPGTHNR